MTDNRTTEQTATERLRALLDERGVKYEVTFFETFTDTEWRVNDASCTYTELQDADSAYFTIQDITPEQAIAATLGKPKVKKVRGMTYDEHGGEIYFLACSGCGDWVDGDLDCIGEYDGPNFCHNCGGEFDGPLMCKVCGELADMEFGNMCAECYWNEGEGNDD